MRSTILTLVAVVGVVTMLGGCRHRHGHDIDEIHKYVSWRVDGLLDDIDATGDQRKVVEGAEERLFETAKQHRVDKDRDALALVAEWESDEPNVDAIRALIDKKLEQHRAFAYQAVDEAIAIHEALEPAQRAELAEMIKERLADH